MRLQAGMQGKGAPTGAGRHVGRAVLQVAPTQCLPGGRQESVGASSWPWLCVGAGAWHRTAHVVHVMSCHVAKSLWPAPAGPVTHSSLGGGRHFQLRSKCTILAGQARQCILRVTLAHVAPVRLPFCN